MVVLIWGPTLIRGNNIYFILYRATIFTTRTYTADTGRKLNVHKTFIRRPGCFLNVLCTFNLRPVSTGMHLFLNRSNLIGNEASIQSTFNEHKAFLQRPGGYVLWTCVLKASIKPRWNLPLKSCWAHNAAIVYQVHLCCYLLTLS